ncbi:hypothetical protein C8J57DRAFT_1290293 [Mycena rebaudengoi]|nr:hypothetical protein C8J57DRAFT_1290293 [Mycena rebaudengoi]
MDGETSPLLSGATTPTLLRDSDSELSHSSQDPRASFSWLIPVVAMAALSNAVNTFSRLIFFRQFVCEEIGGLPTTPDPSLLQTDATTRLDCSSPTFLSGTLSINIASMIFTCILSALTTGWWSRLGDIHGRRYALLVPTLGSVLLNLLFAVVAGSPTLGHVAQPCMFIGLVIEGVLGGPATYHAAVHAYASDVSPAGSWSTIFSVIQGLSILSTILGHSIGMAADFLKPFLSFGISAGLGLLNLTFIFFFLPESNEPEFHSGGRNFKISIEDVKRSIYSPVAVFLADSTAPGPRLILFGLAFFLYSLTSASETFQLFFLRGLSSPSPFSAGFFAAASVLVRMASLFFVFPAILYFLKKRHPHSLATSTTQYVVSVLSRDRSIARYAILVLLTSQLLLLIVPTSRSTALLLLALITPLTVGIKPVLYSLGVTQVKSGPAGRGVFLGALSVLYMVGESISYVVYVSAYSVLWKSLAKAGIMMTAALLTVVAIFLWPSRSERIRRDAERIRIIVSDTSVGAQPSQFSPVQRRHVPTDNR